MYKSTKQQKGFTLVEIVIVLAIAALILAGILFAVNGAQQSRRDSARRDHAGQIASLLEESAGNHDGQYPGGPAPAITTAQFTTLVNNRIDAPRAVNYTLTYPAMAACPAPSAWSVEEAQVMINAANRQYRVCMHLESQDWFGADNF